MTAPGRELVRRRHSSRADAIRRNKPSRIVRLLDIVILTSSEPNWTASRLARRFGISRRRIFHDLEALRQAGCPLIADAQGFRPLRPDLHLPVTLSISEVLALLRPVGGSGEFARTARLKLTTCLPIPLRKLFRSPERVFIQDQTPAVDARVCSMIDHALAENRLLRLSYRGVRDVTTRKRVVEPHVLFTRGTGWYLAAWSQEASALRLFRLDRIESVELLSEQFETRPEVDVRDYLSHTIGVWPGRALDARVEVLSSHVGTVRSEAMSRGMGFRISGTVGVLEIPYGNVDEVAWWLAQFGEGVRVLRPPELRARLVAIGRRICELNRGEGKGSPHL